MNASTAFNANTRKLSTCFEGLRTAFWRHPEWRTWLLSFFAWVLFSVQGAIPAHEANVSGSPISCMPGGPVGVTGLPAQALQNSAKGQGLSSGAWPIILNDLGRWILMVAAMMFPLLNEPIRHVAFSVKRKNRGFGILGFLLGYTLLWTGAGVLFRFAALLLEKTPGVPTGIESSLLKASGFLLAALLIWLPSRAAILTRCRQTVPICIGGWRLPVDCLSYGFKMGIACLHMCWAPMVALLLTHHTLSLMAMVTLVLLSERYLLSHTSKRSGYLWGVLALPQFVGEFGG